MNFFFNKKILVTLLIVSFIVPSVLFLNPIKTNAQLMTFSPMEFALAVKDFIKDDILDALAWGLVNTVIDQIAQQTINWINNGFEGRNPFYITNLENYLGFVCTKTLNSFVDDMRDSELNDINKSLIAYALLANQPCSTRGNNRYQPVSQSVLDNFERDFTGRKGWSAWRRVTMNSRNSIYGQYMVSSAELNRNLRQAAYYESEQLRWGSGFLSQRECVQSPPPTNPEDCTDYKTSTPGSIIEERLNKALGFPEERLTVADEISEIMSALLNQLTRQIFGGVRNILGSDDSSGRSSNSYDQTNNARRVSDLKTNTITYINLNIKGEEGYITIKETSITVLEIALEDLEMEKMENQLITICLLSCTEKRIAIENAIDTLNTLKESVLMDISSANTIISRLTYIKDRTSNEETLNGVRGMAREHDLLKSQLHINDVTKAANELNSIQRTIEDVTRGLSSTQNTAPSAGPNITVTVNEDGSISYSAPEGFSVVWDSVTEQFIAVPN